MIGSTTVIVELSTVVVTPCTVKLPVSVSALKLTSLVELSPGGMGRGSFIHLEEAES